MAEELPSLEIDTDWKKQAQEEKRRLAEEAQKRQAAAPPAPVAAPSAAVAAPASGAPAKARGRQGAREIPQASFSSLVQSLLSQTLYYLGELDGSANLDMAKHHIDQLGILEQKTVNNLDESESRTLDTALYEARSRFVSVATQFI